MRTTTIRLTTLLFLFSFYMIAQTACYEKISAGKKHTLAIRNDGTLWAWGENSYFQIGNGNVVNQVKAIQIGTDTDWASISAGGQHSLAIKTNGTLWGWGSNSNLQVGSPSQLGATQNFANIVVPTQIGTETSWTLCEAGNNHSLAIKLIGNTRTLWSWGRNVEGQLGRTTNGGVASGDYAQVGSFTNWTSVQAGEYHSIGLRLYSQTGRTIWAWGSNSNGQLGTGNLIHVLEPTQVGAANNWTSVRAGGFHNIARKTDGSLWSWGANESGQLGIGTNTQVASPTMIGADLNWSETAYDCGYRHSVAKKTNNILYSWGQNADGQLSNCSVTGYNSPFAICTAFGLVNSWTNNITAGLAHSVAQNGNDLSFYSWGYDGNGELGNGQGTSFSFIYPSLVICSTSLKTEAFKNSKIELFPNPTSSILNFKTKEGTMLSNIKIIDVLGNIVLEINQNSNNINVQNLSNGIYTIQFIYNAETYREKFIKN